MSVTGHIRKRVNKNSTTYQVIVESSSANADGSRNRIFKTIKGTKKDAEKLLREMITEVENQSYVKNNNITLDVFIKDWLDLYIKDNVSPTTMEQYVNQVNNYIIPKFGNKRLQDIKNIDIQRWINELKEKSPRSDKPLSPKSIKNIFLNLSACLDKAVMQELIKKNPCENITLPKIEKHEVNVYNQDEITQMLNCAKGTDMYLPLMMEICLGLRRGELLGLKWKHIDFANSIVNVRENLVEVGNQLITKSPKTSSGVRDIQIPETLLKLLKEYYILRLSDKLSIDDEYIIIQTSKKNYGKPFKSDSFSLKFRRFLKKNNLRHIRFHDLRHCNATLLLSLGVSPKIIQQRLGHSNYQITMDIYSHVLPSVEKESAIKLDNALFNKTD